MKQITSFQGEYRWLSNFWLTSLIMSDGIQYKSSEHAFVAQKTLDMDDRREIAKIKTPGQAKRYGRSLELRPDWQEVRLAIMYNVILHKFAQNDNLAAKLRATEDALLIEGNTWGDQFWGICDGKGLNWLGRILTLTRSIITLERS